MQTTPEYAQTMEKRREQIDGAQDDWWMEEIEALRAEMKETVEEVKSRNNDILEILTTVRGVQETLNLVTIRVPTLMGNGTPSRSVPTSGSALSTMFSPNS